MWWKKNLWSLFFINKIDFICDLPMDEKRRKKLIQTKWYLNKNMWCGAIWFRDIFNIKKNPRKGEKKMKPTATSNAIVQYYSVKNNRGKKKSEIEITFLNSHFVNWREVNKRSNGEKKKKRFRIKTGGRAVYCQICYMAPQHIHG